VVAKRVVAKRGVVKRVAVVGALGRMGECVRAALADDPALTLGAALEGPGHPGIGSALDGNVRVVDDAKAAFASCDVAIDFTVPAATLANVSVAADAGIGYVTGTTGFDAAQKDELRSHAERIPIVHAPNFSVAVNVLAWLVRNAAGRLGSGYDAEIVELHHGQKRDAPSGTALLLAEAVAAGRGVPLAEHLLLERAGDVGARPEGQIGIQTLRGGDNTGEHTVMFVGGGERLELVHRSSTRDHFARGAVRAAGWIAGRPAGWYAIEEVLGLE
jgi:4-hydroxy-tetrahydrodipicolinate reductase